MEGKPIPLPAPARAKAPPASPTGEFVALDGEAYYRIRAYHRLDPFLMSLPSDTDLWMFVASGGGLTAGRVDADGSLFPYRTVDQLHDAHHHTGPVTLIQLTLASGDRIHWEPLAAANDENPAVERNLYKNTLGNRLVFEEIHHDLKLAFRYRWSACDEFGWVKTATLTSHRDAPVRLALLDGLRNVLPFGAPLSLYQHSSNVVDAYKVTEADPATGLCTFSLTAGITDRAEALEVLRANTVWCLGLPRFQVHLSGEAVAAFRHGRSAPAEHVLKGGRGNYLVTSSLLLEAGESLRWHVVGDVGLDHVRIAALRRRLGEEGDLADQLEAGLGRASESLRRIVGSADGLQLSAHPEVCAHHFASVLFNSMRGGVFLRDHDVPVADFADFLRVRQRAVAARHQPLLAALPSLVTAREIRDRARLTGDADFRRLSHEYLPLYFSRRHGDPSRPWNRFSIRARDRTGARELNYEGNWRDIFQNWEALGTAFPGFLPHFVAKFVNASTVDGFNPYRIARDGVDWETVSPDDPWSNIGYWGDHQIVYLLRLLEALDRYHPDALGEMMGEEIFSYAEVPYRIKPYADLVRDPSATIVYDDACAARIAARVAGRGTDGKLLTAPDGSVHHVNLFEKLLVPALSKLSNLILDAGIWMNTQRPEWNDANNALGAGGVSVVTLCHLRRYLAFLDRRLAALPPGELSVSREIAAWFDRIASVLERERGLLAAARLDPRDRRRLLDLLGSAFSDYRQAVYARGFSGKTGLAVSRAVALCRTALAYIDWGIAANRRPDGLFHTYNLLDIAAGEEGIAVVRLPLMIEGQVAALDAGVLAPEEALDLLRRLFASPLYRPDQRSFMLYPERQLPGFMARNAVPAARVEAIPLLRDLLAAGNPALLARDAEGVHRFRGDFTRAADLEAALDDLGRQDAWAVATARDRAAILDLFEDVFRHKSYTGRSGVMYAYEGIGCIYWHMVAKLLLATQDLVMGADRDRLAPPVRDELAKMYYRIRAGLGYEKTVAEFGAFPTDPYSHTPARGGAKQPGLTGQVKEEILTRAGELGIRVERGGVRFEPRLLRADEFLGRPDVFHYHDRQGQARSLALSFGQLAFTVCQVPVVYARGADQPWLRVVFADGTTAQRTGNRLDADLGAELFARTGRIERIQVGIPDHDLCRIERNS